MTNSIFEGLDFYVENRVVIFGYFFPIFACKIFNIDVESTKIVSKMNTMDRITKKISDTTGRMTIEFLPDVKLNEEARNKKN